MPPDEQNDDLLPTEDSMSPTNRNEPGTTNRSFEVPADVAAAGYDTNLPRADSPESLDEEISQGANREEIDPHHSITRPEGSENVKELHEDSFERPE